MVTATRTDSESQAIEDLRLVNSELQRVSLPIWLDLDLPMAQLKALVAIATSERVSVTGLARTLSVGEPAASQIVEQLVRRGYAARTPDPADRRRVVVTVTPPGSHLVAELTQGRRHVVGQWLSAMKDEDVEALARGLRALASAIADEQGSPLK